MRRASRRKSGEAGSLVNQGTELATEVVDQLVQLGRTTGGSGQGELSPSLGKDLGQPFGGFDDALDEDDVLGSNDDAPAHHPRSDARRNAATRHVTTPRSDERILDLSRGLLLPPLADALLGVLDDLVDVLLERR